MTDVATIGLRVDSTGALRGIGDVEKSLLGAEGRAAMVGKAITAAFVATGAALGALAIGVARNTQESEAAFAQLEARVKSTGGVAGFSAEQLRDMAGALQSVSTFGDEAIQDMQALLLTFTNIRGDQFEAASEAVTNLATAMGGDLKGAALQVGKALNDPIAGVSALSRAGVQLSDSQTQAIEQLVKMGDTAGAQKVILKELETQFGGAAHAARNTMGGALAALKNSFGDMLEVPAIITPITNVLNTLADFFAKSDTKKAVADFVKSMANNFLALGSAVLESVGVMVSGISTLSQTLYLMSGVGGFKWVSKSTDEFSQAIVKGLMLIDELVVSLNTTTKATTTTAGSLLNLGGNLDKVGDVVTHSSGALEQQTEVLRLWREEQQKGAAVLVELFKTMERGVPMQQIALPESTLIDVIIPVEKTQGKLESLFGWLVTEGQLVTENLGNAFMETFSNIAARGKVAFGDLFNTIAGLFKAGSGGSALFGGLGIGASIVGGAMASRSAEVEQAEQARRAYEKEIANFNRMLADWAQDIAGYATDFDAALADVNRRIDDRIREARAIFDAANPTYNTGTAKAVEALNKQLEELEQLRLKEIAAIKKRNEDDKQAMGESLQIRALEVAGLSEAADLMRLEIQQRKELADAQRLGIDLLTVQNVQEAERNRLLADQERERGFTIGSLDAEIARVGGNDELAQQIERDIARQRTLADVTDETIRAKYEELYALQDVNRAVAELAAAAEQAAKLQAMSEDLEVRRLVATGKSIEAEARRFELEQARELREAENAFAAGEITQDILDALREVLGLEAGAFAERQTAGGTTTSATPGLGGRSTQVGPLQATASWQVADVDRVVGQQTTMIALLRSIDANGRALNRAGGIVGVVNSSLQNDTTRQRVTNGNIVVS